MKQSNFNAPFGQAAEKIVNHYGNVTRYQKMSEPELRVEREALLRERRAVFREFILHPTVWWFGGSMGALLTFLVATWGAPPSPTTGIVLAICLVAVSGTVVWMTRRRRAMLDALQMVKADIHHVEALIVRRGAAEATRHPKPAERKE
ncbi:hypothetical protein [Rhodocyclus gracilis]|uniref:Uncharacterized protein n=1 Tax=Rhodocyclus tenuis TaxID=1066 RepID=A0A6L5JUN2_RHOTE|nr:hypothetical protein [Rhodocyclus gracilis]MQY50761.1 hypothetical protein [Rhodocyclus gracilis]